MQEQEKTQLGSTVTREITMSSLPCFEAMDLGNGWTFLGSCDGRKHHSTWMNPETNQLITFVEGDVITKTAPNKHIFACEVITEQEFCIYGG